MKQRRRPAMLANLAHEKSKSFNWGSVNTEDDERPTQRMSAGGFCRGQFDLRSDIKQCMQALRDDVESCMQRHQEQLEQTIDRKTSGQTALSVPSASVVRPLSSGLGPVLNSRPVSTGWRSAPGETKPIKQIIQEAVEQPRPVSRSAQRDDMEVDSVCSETPRKLPPPPNPGTPIARPSRVDMVRKVSYDYDLDQAQRTALAFSPRSGASTCTGPSNDLQSGPSNSTSNLVDTLVETIGRNESAEETEDPGDRLFPLPGSSFCDPPPGPPLILDSQLEAAEEFGVRAKPQPLTTVDPRWSGTQSDVSSDKSHTPGVCATMTRLDSRWATPSANNSGKLAMRRMDTSRSLNNYSPLSARRRQMMFAEASVASRVTKSQAFELASAIIIVLNAIFIVWEADWRASFVSSSTPGFSLPKVHEEGFDREYFFYISTNIFCVLFLIDVLLRCMAERWFFLRSREWGWNLFDSVVCLTAVVEAAIQWYLLRGGESDARLRSIFRRLSMLRILRLLRVIRVARGLKFIRFIRELRMMVFSLTSSMRALAWSAVLITIMLMAFSVFFTDGVVAYCRENNLDHAESTADMRHYFGRVSTSAISLFMAMTGGEDWGNLLHSLEALPAEYSALFLSFISFAVLALLNLVTAVFINAAMQRSQNDRELAVQQELENKEELVQIIQQVFMELDTDRSGSLTMEELEKHIEDDKIMAYLRSRQIDISQVKTLFTLLDTNQTGEVSMDEFVQGIVRLKGVATSMDLAVLSYQVEYMVEVLSELVASHGLGDRQGQRSDDVGDKELVQVVRNSLGARLTQARPRTPALILGMTVEV